VAKQKQEFKYLAIRNWSKFQSMTDKNGKNLDGKSRPYIRDYTDKETDSQYAELSVFGRYFFDACRRLRGKWGRNIPNDHMWILRQLDVHHAERGRGVLAIQALIRRGLLIPTSQQLDIPQPAADNLTVTVEVPVEVKNTVTDGNGTGLATALQEGNGKSNPNPTGASHTGETPDPRKVTAVFTWATKVSNHWSKSDAHGHPRIQNAQDVLRSWSVLEKQYDKYYARAKVKPHEVPPTPEEQEDQKLRSFIHYDSVHERFYVSHPAFEQYGYDMAISVYVNSEDALDDLRVNNKVRVAIGLEPVEDPDAPLSNSFVIEEDIS